MRRAVAQDQRGAHEQHGSPGRDLAEYRSRARSAEDALTRTAKDGADVRPFARLQQHDDGQKETGKDVKDGQ